MFDGWGKAAGDVEVLLMVGLMRTEVWEPSLSTCMSISRKVTWEGEKVQVNRNNSDC